MNQQAVEGAIGHVIDEIRCERDRLGTILETLEKVREHFVQVETPPPEPTPEPTPEPEPTADGEGKDVGDC